MQYEANITYTYRHFCKIEANKEGKGLDSWMVSKIIIVNPWVKAKLDIGLFVDFCVFTCFYQFLNDVIIKLFCLDLHNNIMITLWKNG